MNNQEQEQEIQIIRSGTTPSSTNNESTLSTIKYEYSTVSVPFKTIKKQMIEFDEYYSYKPPSLHLEKEEEEKIRRTMTIGKEIKQKQIRFNKPNVLKKNYDMNTAVKDNSNSIGNNVCCLSLDTFKNEISNNNNNIYFKKRIMNQSHFKHLSKTNVNKDKGIVIRNKIDSLMSKADKEKLVITQADSQQIISNINANSTITFRMSFDSNKKELINKVNQCVNVASFQLTGVKKNMNFLSNNILEQKVLIPKETKISENNKGTNDNISVSINSNSNRSLNNNNIIKINKSIKINDLLKANLHIKVKKRTSLSFKPNKIQNQQIDNSKRDKKVKLTTIHQKRNSKVHQTKPSLIKNNNKTVYLSSELLLRKSHSLNSGVPKLILTPEANPYIIAKQKYNSYSKRIIHNKNDTSITTEQSTNSKRTRSIEPDNVSYNRKEDALFSKRIKYLNNNQLTLSKPNNCLKYNDTYSNYYHNATLNTINNSRNQTETDDNKYNPSLTVSKLYSNPSNKHINNEHKSILSNPRLLSKESHNKYEAQNYSNKEKQANYSHFNCKSLLNASSTMKQPTSHFNKSETPIILKQKDKYDKHNHKSANRNLNYSSHNDKVNEYNHNSTISLIDEKVINSSLISYNYNTFLSNTVTSPNPNHNHNHNNSFTDYDQDDDYSNHQRYKREIYEKAFESPDYQAYQNKREFSTNNSNGSILKCSLIRSYD